MRASDIVVDDATLTLGAKGAFVVITLLGPGCSLEEIAKHCLGDAAVVAAAVRELESHGYVDVVGGRASVRDTGEFGMI